MKKHYFTKLIGYLSGDDVRHVCSSYSAAFQMNISSGRIQVRILLLIGKFLTFELILAIFCLLFFFKIFQEAIGNARAMDPGTGLVNIGLFCRFLDNVVNR